MSDAKPARVLVVEDNDASAGDYILWLRSDGRLVERAAAASDAVAKAAAFGPDVVLLDLQIPSEPARADENVEHGFRTLDALLQADPFRPIVVATAHSRDRELMRRVMQRTRGGAFVFKDADDVERELLKAVAVALASPAYLASRTVRELRRLVERNEDEEVYRKFIHRHWDLILGPEYRECRSPYEIARGANIDLLAIRHDGFPDLWELKRPEDPVFRSYNQRLHHSLECARAVGQVMEYLDATTREARSGNLSYEARRGISVELARPCGFVVIGRYANEAERERLRLENSYLANLTILTYDDLVERAAQLLTFLHRHRNGHGDH